MTVTTELSRASFPWTGVETSFACGFPADQVEDLDVVFVTPGGITIPLTLGVNHSATLAPTSKIVTVTPITLPAATGTVVVQRTTPALVSESLVDGQDFSLEVIQQLHDRAAMRSGEDRTALSRAFTLPIGVEPGAGNFDLKGSGLANMAPGVASTDAATVSQLQDIVAGSGNVPSPTLGDLGRFLLATGEGAFSWQLMPAGIVGNDNLAAVASGTLKGRVSAGPGDVEDLTPTQARAVLQLGSLALQSAASVAIAGGTIAIDNGLVATPALAFASDPDTGLYRSGADTLAFACGGVAKLQLTPTAVQALQPLHGVDGTAGAPGFAFINDPDTGIYRTGANAIGFATSSTLRFVITDGAGQPTLQAQGQFGFADGSGSQPGISFTNDTDTGIWRATTDQIGFSTSGVERMRLNAGSLGYILGLVGGMKITGSTNDATSAGLVIVNASDQGKFSFRSDGYFQSPDTYNVHTTATAANVFINADGGFFRSTSSERYKQDIQDYERGLADVMRLRPVSFTPKSKEGVATPGDGKRFAGFIAEEVDALGLHEFVDYDAEDRPDALHYAQMTALLVKALQEANTRIDAMAARLDALEAKGDRA